MDGAPVPSPYKGLARYEEEDAPYFFGRIGDAELVVANVLASRLTLLFGESGVGKSSLLHAGAAPRLRAVGDLVPVIFSDWRGDAAASLASALRRACGLDGDLVDEDLAATIAACAEASGDDLVIVLDQFEEYFIYHPDEDGGDRFTREFARAVTRADLPVSFVISIREDALAHLERFKGRVPGVFDTYLRLDRLGRDAAREAIVAPLALHATLHPDDAVSAEPVLVEQVLDQVEVGRVAFGGTGAGLVDGGTATGTARTRSIEAPYLQLVLARLWDEERRAGSRVLRLETLERLGGAERIVRTHLDVALGALDPDEQEIAAAVFRYLVTPSGTKIAHRVDDLAEYAGYSPEAVAPVLTRLASGDVRVLRPVGEDAYEIYHDVLAAAVLDWRGRYLHQRELDEAERRRRSRVRLALAALALAVVAGVAAGITIWRVQAGRTADAQRRERAQALKAARALPYARSVYAGHAGVVRSLAFAPDDRRVVSADEHGDVRIWESATGHQVAALHIGGELRQADFSPDGELVVAAGDKGEAIVWRWRSGQKVATLSEPYSLDGAAFSPNGQLVALPGDNGTIQLWDWRSRRVIGILDGHGGVVTAVAWSKGGQLLAAGSDDGNVRVWDWRRRRILATLAAGSRGVDTVAFSPDGRHVAAGSEDALARLWDWRGRRLVWSRRADSSPDVAFSPDGTIIASADTHGDVLLTDWRNRHTLARLREAGAATVTFSPDGCLVASSGYDHWARVWAPPLHGCRR